MTKPLVTYREEPQITAVVKALADMADVSVSQVLRALVRAGLHNYGFVDRMSLDLELGALMMNWSREEVLSAAFPNGGDDEDS